jgi:hypothetical protein
MAIVRSDQKGMEEVQRIREALAGGCPVLTEAQEDLIRQQSNLLGEDGDAVMRAIQEDAMSAGRLPADVAKIIEKCCQDLVRRVARLEKSNEVEREREPQRLLQIEAMREQVSKCATTKERGNNADLMRVKQALLALLSKYLKDMETDEKDGLSSDVVETWKQAALDFTGDVLKGKGRSSEGAPKGGGKSSSRAGKEGPGMQSGEESKEWRPSSRGQEVPPDPPSDPGPRNKVMQARAQPEAHEHECR